MKTRLLYAFPAYRAETADGAAVAPAGWDEPKGSAYDTLA